LLFIGVAGNLLLLSYYKYSGFLLENLTYLTHHTFELQAIELPIGISFFTFTQIAFLVDSYRGEVREYTPIKYGLFVTYFPHLIAGPIIHHKEIMPQFDARQTYTPQLESIVRGLTWFAAGLFKKVLLADNLGPYVEPAFKSAAAGAHIAFADAWLATATYALQIYFDFSGYSDMAIGLALTMGIKFPLNFNSPYKADSLIDFWRRWHMTLSRFLRDYLYIPLGGNRKGSTRRYINLMVTMMLGGLWHGATWNFVAWGTIHGIGLTLNHLWRGLSVRLGISLPRPVAITITLFVVMLGWVPFRADTLSTSLVLWKSMLGIGGFHPPLLPFTTGEAMLIAACFAIALWAPNTADLLGIDKRNGIVRGPHWWPNPTWAVAMGCLFGIAVAQMINGPTTFLYFRF
jgi:D-alanyl-lipoteichoic acid acyltransferase DltB (MBOAT superfamily)